MFIVSDDVLERLICSQCKKYLSVKVVKVYPNRGIKCGRCSNAGDAGVISLFGVLADEALFRCVNRFEGCNQLLSYSDVAEHEKCCIGKEYDCPCCVQTFKGTAYEVYIHFKEQHLERLLVNNPEFILEIDNELVRSYLYCKNDLLFYINARYNRGEEELILNVVFLGTDQDASKITQMFALHSLDSKMKHKTRRKICTSVTGGNIKCFRINLSPVDYPKDIVVCRFDLNTENVENLLALPEILKKSKGYVGDKLKLEEGWFNNIIKPSVFDKYPVTVFNPSASVVHPTNSAFGFGSIPVFPNLSSVSSNVLNTATTASSVFGNARGQPTSNQIAGAPTLGNLLVTTNSQNRPNTTSFGSIPVFPNSSSVPSNVLNTATTASSIFSNAKGNQIGFVRIPVFPISSSDSSNVLNTATTASSIFGNAKGNQIAGAPTIGNLLTTNSNSQKRPLGPFGGFKVDTPSQLGFNFSSSSSGDGLFQSNRRGQDNDKKSTIFGSIARKE